MQGRSVFPGFSSGFGQPLATGKGRVDAARWSGAVLDRHFRRHFGRDFGAGLGDVLVVLDSFMSTVAVHFWASFWNRFCEVLVGF